MVFELCYKASSQRVYKILMFYILTPYDGLMTVLLEIEIKLQAFLQLKNCLLFKFLF